MSLLREIQDGATDSSADLPTVLRKAMRLAAILKNREFAEWVERELNGYPPDVDLPPYRITSGRLIGSFSMTFQRLATLPIPVSVLPEKLRAKWGGQVMLRESVATYTALLLNPQKGELTMHWPADMARLYGSAAFEEAFCTDAWIALNPSSLSRLVDSVRSRLVGFAIAIESENPEAGEASVRDTPVRPEIVTQSFHTNIYGGTNNVAAGGGRVSQRQKLAPVGDFELLRRSLESAGASGEEIAELQMAVANVDTHDEQQSAADSWLGRTARRAAYATRAFTIDLAAKAIADYLRPPGS